jgi:hypothetical protein
MDKVALAATIHDPDARLVPAITRAAALLRNAFAGIALNVTDATPAGVIDAAAELLDARVITHPQGEATIGRSRRDAVGLALQFPVPAILYCDFDHVIRWAEGSFAEMRAALVAQPGVDCLVIGRAGSAFESEPERLRETERLINRAYTLMTGRDWDLMFAIRRLSRPAAQAIVRESREDSIANDVEWPLLAERLGLSLGYVAADGLYYRTMDGFDAPTDTEDGDALQWIRRIEIAAVQASAMRPFLRRS